MLKDHPPEVVPNLQKLSPDSLQIDGGTQPRGRLDEEVCRALRRGDEGPPLGLQ